MTGGWSFACPVCGAVSHHPRDAEEGYCGACHWWTGDPILAMVREETELGDSEAHAMGRRIAEILAGREKEQQERQ